MALASGSVIEGGEIPSVLAAPAAQALAWLNETGQHQFELTGVVDYDEAIAGGLEQPFEFGLVLCDGEICKREQVRFNPVAGGYQFSAGEIAEREIPSLLDPPPGVRTDWLERELDKHEFVVFLFYRGLW